MEVEKKSDARDEEMTEGSIKNPKESTEISEEWNELNGMLGKFSLEELNEALKKADQAIQEEKAEGIEEYKRTIKRMRNDQISTWIKSQIASSFFKIKCNSNSIGQFLNGRGESGVKDWLNACSEACLKEGVRVFNKKDAKSYSSTQNLEFIDRESAIEDLEVLSMRFAIGRFLDELDGSQLRTHCKALDINQTGTCRIVTKRIMDKLYSIPLRDMKEVNVNNEHPDDEILNGSSSSDASSPSSSASSISTSSASSSSLPALPSSSS
eukprot:TRINITY_DN1745_c1_g1_i1.p1 TRINITY_DN1745_c1_g1~~TRINITY_DN1745_c1_g1_i1.p1  ORF type:complete len:267 (+),score=116.43 TRINITY_DN1745_c1_g1_i1:260-1060(+)